MMYLNSQDSPELKFKPFKVATDLVYKVVKTVSVCQLPRCRQMLTLGKAHEWPAAWCALRTESYGEANLAFIAKNSTAEFYLSFFNGSGSVQQWQEGSSIPRESDV